MVADAGLDDPKDPAAVHRALQRVSDVLEQASLEGRAALTALRASALQRNDLAEAIEQAAEDCVSKNSMAFSLMVEGSVRDIHPIVRDEVYRIAYEAMRNACSHSKGTRLEVKLSYARGLVIRVADNGVGIDEAVIDKGREGHFGIKGMLERAQRIGGTLAFRSTNSGTEVELMVPRNVAFRENKVTSVAETKKLRRFFRWRR
jgi:signal transduction histidine kinase